MNIDRIAFWFAAMLSFGSLILYVLTAFSYRREPDEKVDPHEDFNLGVPRLRNVNSGFGASLLAAGTSLSTVLVFFLTATPLFGWWLMLCPVMFAAGNFVLYVVYHRTVANGFFLEDAGRSRGSAGLVPYLVDRLTGSSFAGWIALLLSALNLLAVLSLELIVGVQVLQYLLKGVFGFELGPVLEFVVYAVSIALLLGYVFIGGFRASIASDQYQAMAMKIAITVAAVALTIVAFRADALANLSQIPSAVPFSILGFFALNVILGNLFVPLAQEASWQRFRAFKDVGGFDPRAATISALLQSGWLWALIIVTSFALFAVTAATSRGELASITGCFDQIRSLDRSWFPLLVFPLIVVAALSAMYSTADTCVSAFLYLIEYGRKREKPPMATHDATLLDHTYYFAMMAIFLLSLGVYVFVRYLFSPTILQLVFSVFSNLVVLAPSVLLASFLSPQPAGVQNKQRSLCVITSIVLGSAGYWIASISAMVLGASYLWLSQAAIAIGLFIATLPTLPILFSARRS